jgi:hypothetical protein
MTIKSVMWKTLFAVIEWAILIGLTMLVLWVDGFWVTLGVMWLTCVIASAAGVVRALVSGKVRLVLPEPPAPTDAEIATYDAEHRRDGGNDFLLFADHVTE